MAAKEHGVVVSFDLEKHVVDEYGLERLKTMLELTDILLSNKLDIKTLTGREDLVEAAREIMRCGPKLVVISAIRGV